MENNFIFLLQFLLDFLLIYIVVVTIVYANRFKRFENRRKTDFFLQTKKIIELQDKVKFLEKNCIKEVRIPMEHNEEQKEFFCTYNKMVLSKKFKEEHARRIPMENKPEFTQEQEYWLCYQIIDEWYLDFKEKISSMGGPESIPLDIVIESSCRLLEIAKEDLKLKIFSKKEDADET